MDLGWGDQLVNPYLRFLGRPSQRQRKKLDIQRSRNERRLRCCTYILIAVTEQHQASCAFRGKAGDPYLDGTGDIRGRVLDLRAKLRQGKLLLHSLLHHGIGPKDHEPYASLRRLVLADSTHKVEGLLACCHSDTVRQV